MADLKQEREAFEKWARDAFVCSEYSFVRAYAEGYINTVQSQTFGGRVQPRYADVQMLWDAWLASRETSRGVPGTPQEQPKGGA